MNEKLRSLRKILFLFLMSRCVIFLALMDRIYPYADYQLKMDHPLLDPFILYDSYNYAQIALEGYNEIRLTAFFPLYPLLVRALAIPTGWDVYWIGFLLSNLFFILSLWMIDRLLEEGQWAARTRTIILLVFIFFPSSYYFSAFYTESFFLFLAILSFRLWEKEKREWAYIIGGFAALTRIVGGCIPLAFFVDRLLNRKLDRKDVTYSFLAFLLFLIYPIYLWKEKGDPFLFLKVQAPFYNRLSVPPFFPIFQDILYSVEKVKNEHMMDPVIIFHFILFIVFIGYVIKNIQSFRKGQLVYWAEMVYTFGLTVFPLSSMLESQQKIASHGYMRYFLPIFPLFIFMGGSFERWITKISQIKGIGKRILAKLAICLFLTGWILISLYIWYGLRFKGFVA